MAIQILSPRLANQIAAGEVVERPASVVKELVENSMDAGATMIQIDIERGGGKLVRIRDNGRGVPKDELPLALSRHATSKIASLEDLEAIISLGFRGEALASISSVCRLTFTSRTADQTEAWQAYAQGRDMAVEITPAAHPVGTTVEVHDLFFNTPARRRFLRTEKTEFAHIDELIRRFALSRFDIHFVLKHNGKTLRNLRPAKDLAQQERRVASICGHKFMEQALAVESTHNDITLKGWLGLPAVCRPQTDMQYCYVNGRMMRDRLINHAIRQAYQELLPEGLCPAYVLYIELDAGQVDVNVHPAKHEVRFHQSRLVHDFIYQVLHQALSQAPMHPAEGAESEIAEPAATAAEAVAAIPAYPGRGDYRPPAAAQRHQYGGGQGGGGYQGSARPSREPASGVRAAAVDNYQQLMTTPYQGAPVAAPVQSTPPALVPAAPEQVFGRPLSLVAESYLLAEEEGKLYLWHLPRLSVAVLALQLAERWQQGLVGQPLLLPVAITLDQPLLEQVSVHEQVFRRLGVDIHRRDPQIMIRKVPELLRERDLARLIPELLQLLAGHPTAGDSELQPLLCQWLAEQGGAQRLSYQDSLGLFADAQSRSESLLSKLNFIRQRVCLDATLGGFGESAPSTSTRDK